jgi:hypothetical protein
MKSMLPILVAAALTACASAPRGPAASLADAGIKTTNAFGTDVRTFGNQLASGSANKAFATTWDVCANTDPKICQVSIEGAEVTADRLLLAKAIHLRGRALDALGGAYEALKVEAKYDAGADLSNAVGDAVDSVNTYAALLGSPAVAAALGPIKQVALVGTRAWADREQTRRLQSANAQIASITQALRQALAKEAAIFDSVGGAIAEERFYAQAAMLDAGRVSGGDMLRPTSDELGLILVKDADAKVLNSVRVRTAVIATYKARQQAEVRAQAARYQASLAALDALLAMHVDFADGQPADLHDVKRFLDELDAVVTASKT